MNSLLSSFARRLRTVYSRTLDRLIALALPLGQHVRRWSIFVRGVRLALSATMTPSDAEPATVEAGQRDSLTVACGAIPCAVLSCLDALSQSRTL
jgi:hypothetical protein